jgi:hypothetical protein
MFKKLLLALRVTQQVPEGRVLHLQESVLSPVGMQHVHQKNTGSIRKPGRLPYYGDSFYISSK